MKKKGVTEYPEVMNQQQVSDIITQHGWQLYGKERNPYQFR